MFKKKIKSIRSENSQVDKISKYLQAGRIPWSEGYEEYKVKSIKEALQNDSLKNMILQNKIPEKFGQGVDERIIEYPWIFANIKEVEKTQILDAGSTFNFDFITNQPILEKNKLTIATFAPENQSFNNLGISYVYTDLRETPFKDNFFDIIVSHSTIEHIDMDNSIYGYDISHTKEEIKSHEYLKAIQEYLRILKQKGQLLITFPFGKFENHGFFQQFDSEMLNKISKILGKEGSFELTFFQYQNDGWNFTTEGDCSNIVSFNPHTNRGKGEDGAAHCRSICCINFIKK